MCEFHETTCNGFGDIWWTDNPIYFSSIDVRIIDRNLEYYDEKRCGWLSDNTWSKQHGILTVHGRPRVTVM